MAGGHRATLLIVVGTVTAVDASQLPRVCRRTLIGMVGVSLPPGVAHASSRADLLGGQGQGCTYGEGDNCDALAEGNELILRLQKRSRDNKEKNELDLYEMNVAKLGCTHYWIEPLPPCILGRHPCTLLDQHKVTVRPHLCCRGWTRRVWICTSADDDYLNSVGSVMVRTDASGKYKALSMEEYSAAKRAGRLSPGVMGIENLDATPGMSANGNAASTALPTVSSIDEVKRLMLEGKVDGVVFKAPAGMTALAVSGDKVVPLTFDKAWKREEFVNLVERRGVDNNFRDLLAGTDALSSK